VELCLVEQDYGLPDDHPVSDIWIRLIEGDYTIAGYITPRERGPAGKVARRACFSYTGRDCTWAKRSYAAGTNRSSK
jgi:hypothetical protein